MTIEDDDPYEKHEQARSSPTRKLSRPSTESECGP
jgi:hypothetical protein